MFDCLLVCNVVWLLKPKVCERIDSLFNYLFFLCVSAAREARAKIIAAEGEQKASRSLKEAADVINESPIALQLRYLQTLTHISAEKNSTIVFPIPGKILVNNSLFVVYCCCFFLY